MEHRYRMELNVYRTWIDQIQELWNSICYNEDIYETNCQKGIVKNSLRIRMIWKDSIFFNSEQQKLLGFFDFWQTWIWSYNIFKENFTQNRKERERTENYLSILLHLLYLRLLLSYLLSPSFSLYSLFSFIRIYGDQTLVLFRDKMTDRLLILSIIMASQSYSEIICL